MKSARESRHRILVVERFVREWVANKYKRSIAILKGAKCTIR